MQLRRVTLHRYKRRSVTLHLDKRRRVTLHRDKRRSVTLHLDKRRSVTLHRDKRRSVTLHRDKSVTKYWKFDKFNPTLWYHCDDRQHNVFDNVFYIPLWQINNFVFASYLKIYQVTQKKRQCIVEKCRKVL